MSEVKRRKGESFESLLRRFQRRMHESGRLIQAKKVRFRKRQLSQTKKRQSAIHRLRKKQKIEYLARIGKLPPEKTRRPAWR